MHGQHYVQNALAAIAVARELQIAPELIAKALANFGGVKRRFTVVGEVGGVKVVDDYAHHPVEIAATLSAARALAGKGNVIAVVQPHRYTRLNSLFTEFCQCFAGADHVVIADIYAAGEAPIARADKAALVAGSQHKSVQPLPAPEALAPMISQLAKAGDVVVCMGAGNITDWAYALPAQLEALQKGAA
jgi:UDP-N-acetylmuramate--alanine ligase